MAERRAREDREQVVSLHGRIERQREAAIAAQTQVEAARVALEQAQRDTQRAGELVTKGSRGVWQDPLLPGKYAFNTYAGKVEITPHILAAKYMKLVLNSMTLGTIAMTQAVLPQFRARRAD